MKQIKTETTYTLTKDELAATLAKALGAPLGLLRLEVIEKTVHDDDYRSTGSWKVLDGIKLIVTEESK